MMAWKHSRQHLIKLFILLGFFFIAASLTACKGHLVGVLNPKGIVAYEERKLFFDTLALMLIVVLPVIIMSFAFVYHYQSSHHIKDYKPNWSHSFFLEALWWGIPCVIIVILAVLTWRKTQELDPFRPIQGENSKPILIEAIALPWKWLFIYREQGIATINYLVVPLNQQVEYHITADNVPMSAFFIPQLGSQIYAMAGMRTRLHLIANHPGTYVGLNTQFNGDGFSDMHFSVHVVDKEKFADWLSQIKQSGVPLTDAVYKSLLTPTIANKPAFFNDVGPHLFENIINTYMQSFGTVHPRAALNNIDSAPPHLKEVSHD